MRRFFKSIYRMEDALYDLIRNLRESLFGGNVWRKAWILTDIVRCKHFVIQFLLSLYVLEIYKHAKDISARHRDAVVPYTKTYPACQ